MINNCLHYMSIERPFTEQYPIATMKTASGIIMPR